MKRCIIALIVFGLVLAGCGSSQNVYTELLISAADTLDPSQSGSQSTFELLTDIYVGPTRITADDEEVNLGAESIDVSDDGLVYTTKLRDDIKWVDNEGKEQGNLTANDYVFGYRRMVDPTVGSVYSYIFENIENAPDIVAGEKDVSELGVVALDDYTLEITLTSQVPYFTNLLAFGSYVAQPEGAYELYGDDFATSADTMWYDGPYYVTGFDPDYIISLQKNDLYFNSEEVEVERVDYRLNTDDTSRLNAVTSGEADYAQIETLENYKLAEEDGVLSTRPTMFSFYLVLNTDSSSATGNENLRKGLSFGFDRETIVNSVYEGMNTPIEYIIPSNLTTASYDGIDYRDVAGDSLVSFDPNIANDYFDAYMKDEELTERSQIEVNFLVNGDSDGVGFAEVVQAYYKENFGITVNIDSTTGGDYKEKRTNGGFDILYTSWAPDYGDPSTYLALWKSSNIGSQNYAQYESEEYDQLYDKANSLIDPELRFKAFAKCEQQLIDDAVLVPVYQKNQAYVIDDNYNMPEWELFILSHEYLTKV